MISLFFFLKIFLQLLQMNIQNWNFFLTLNNNF